MRVEADTAFDSFVRTRYSELLRFGRALTGSVEEGADLVQDALVRTLMAWSRVESQGDPEGYVRRTMVNRNISVWRRRARERDHLSGAVETAEVTDMMSTLIVWAAVRQLPARQRTVIALRYYADLPVAEVARLMGSSPGTVKSQSAKAITHLRHMLGDADVVGLEVSDGRDRE